VQATKRGLSPFVLFYVTDLAKFRGWSTSVAFNNGNVVGQQTGSGNGVNDRGGLLVHMWNMIDPHGFITFEIGLFVANTYIYRRAFAGALFLRRL